MRKKVTTITMSCYSPIQAYKAKNATNDNGKQVIIFQDMQGSKNFESIQLPCGKCIGCRMDYSRMWMARITKEASLYANNCFLTLTYNEENLPIKDVINKETGELITGHPLVKEHLQKFIKRLRRNYEYHKKHTGIRFYACGEYGGRSMRPHYHLALFNIDTTTWGDIKQIGNNKQGDALFTSERIEKIWGKGFITIGDLTPQSAAYIARYMLKKQKGDGKAWYYESRGIVTEYTSMSVKPGISAIWYEQNKDKYWLQDKIIVPQRNKAPATVKTPQYFDKLLEKEDPEKLKNIKESRQRRGEQQRKIRAQQSTLNEWDQLKVEEANKISAARKLIRPLE